MFIILDASLPEGVWHRASPSDSGVQYGFAYSSFDKLQDERMWRTQVGGIVKDHLLHDPVDEGDALLEAVAPVGARVADGVGADSEEADCLSEGEVSAVQPRRSRDAEWNTEW